MNETISYTYLEVGELWIFLFENISHVINQMQTKCIFSGDFLLIRIKKSNLFIYFPCISSYFLIY